MRILRLSKWLALGGAAFWLYQQNRSPTTRDSAPEADRTLGDEPNILPSDLAADPGDPVQSMDEASELRVADLEYDAVSRADAEAAQDLATLSADLDERGGIDEEDTIGEVGATGLESELVAIPTPAAPRDAGELYGVHTPAAMDRSIPDGDASFDKGENWIESLQASATEFGPEPEEDLDVEDEQDLPPHPTDHRDIPVADRGAGGPRGV